MNEGTPDVDRVEVARTKRQAARTRDLSRLLQQRPDLQGVYLPADLAIEAVRWCA